MTILLFAPFFFRGFLSLEPTNLPYFINGLNLSIFYPAGTISIGAFLAGIYDLITFINQEICLAIDILIFIHELSFELQVHIVQFEDHYKIIHY